jgi:hypothetical protein
VSHLYDQGKKQVHIRYCQVRMWVRSFAMGVQILVTVPDCVIHLLSENCCVISKKIFWLTWVNVDLSSQVRWSARKEVDNNDLFYLGISTLS